MNQTNCDRCDTFGGEKTYANQACLPINGRVICVDWCIHQIVAALNAAGVETIASCCGHGKMAGRIDLKDGRVLYVHRKPVSNEPLAECANEECGWFGPETARASSTGDVRTAPTPRGSLPNSLGDSLVTSASRDLLAQARRCLLAFTGEDFGIDDQQEAASLAAEINTFLDMSGTAESDGES